MANWNNLKTAVAQVIKTNGNKEITGQVMQDTLNTIINNVGENATFVGVATPTTNPGVPDGNVFYLASTPGQYTAFGVTVNPGETAILKTTTSSGVWQKTNAGIATTGSVTKVGIQSAGFFFGTPTIDFDAKTISFPSGWFSFGSGVTRNIAAQVLSWTVANSQYVCIDTMTNTWVLNDITVALGDNIAIIGTLDIGSNRLFGNFRSYDPGKYYRPGGNIGCIVGPSFKLSFDFDGIKTPSAQGWTLTTTGIGYLTRNTGEKLITVSPQTITADNNNIVYMYVDAANGNIVTFPYMSKPARSFVNLYFIGVFNPTDGRILINATNIVINGVQPVVFSQTDRDNMNYIIGEIGGPVNETLPAADWLSKSWNSELTPENLFLDTTCKIDNVRRAKSITIDARKAGIIDVHLLDMNYNTLFVWSRTCVVGLNTFSLTGISYTQPYYIAVMGRGTAAVRTIFPNTGNPNGYRVDTTANPRTIIYIGYEMAYTIDITDSSETLAGRVSVLEQKVGINPSDDINVLLSENDVVTLEPKDYAVTSPIIMQSGKVLRGSFGKTRLILTDGCKTAITSTGTTDIKISDLEIVGTEPNYKYKMNGIITDASYNTVVTEDDALNFAYMGDEIGIYLQSVEKVVLENLKIRNITGSAIKCNRVGRDYIHGLNAVNLFITNCYNGIYGYNEHEYSQWTNFTVTLCMIGIYFDSGNLIWTAGHVTRCRVAMMLKEGYNHAHGICNGIELKHNQVAGLLCNGVVYGQFFQGMYISYCNCIMRNCSGLYFDSMIMRNGTLICSNEAAATGKNMIVNFVRRSADVTVNNTGNLDIIETRDLF